MSLFHPDYNEIMMWEMTDGVLSTSTPLITNDKTCIKYITQSMPINWVNEMKTTSQIQSIYYA